ncbi:hypothetical protein E308F_19540 [Moorella sp. E308F]|uniref:hypothetical protein n=1 Tax=Moorella sp. E308F TaxID=2572682 RepID=UPI0010FFBB09|nr:hypothetical protein [Moorella sp. E308F]GEA15710.1 hypothetical protein E308F_19540 [Moorella sp. E308F]
MVKTNHFIGVDLGNPEQDAEKILHDTIKAAVKKTDKKFLLYLAGILKTKAKDISCKLYYQYRRREGGC